MLDVREQSVLTDYFVIASGSGSKQLQAIAYEIEMLLKSSGWGRPHKEGYEVGQWILVDCGDVVVHLLHRDRRKHYDLESHWADAPRVDWKAVPAEEPARQAR